MCRFYDLYNNVLFVAPVVQQLQGNGNEPDVIVAPVVRQLPDTPFDLSEFSDIRNTLFAQIS